MDDCKDKSFSIKYHTFIDCTECTIECERLDTKVIVNFDVATIYDKTADIYRIIAIVKKRKRGGVICMLRT